MKRILITLFALTSVFVAFMMPIKTNNMIYIYDDEGVSKESLLHVSSALKRISGKKYGVKTIDSRQVKSSQWTKNAALFVLPGGADLPYVKKLAGQGNAVIRDYVENGGSLLGICAGAYYCSSSVEFDKGGPLEVIGSRELNFFPGKAIGPVLATYDYRNQSGSRAAKISTIFKDVPSAVVFYNGGGCFEDAKRHPSVTVVATYENDLPAIILMEYGKGKILLSGVHFEYDPGLLDAQDPFLGKILDSLKQANASREKLLKNLMSLLGIK